MAASKPPQLVKIVLSTSNRQEVVQLALHVFWGLFLHREILPAHPVIFLVTDALALSQIAITVTSTTSLRE